MSSSSPSPQTEIAQSIFLRLPLELRRMIYKLLFRRKQLDITKFTGTNRRSKRRRAIPWETGILLQTNQRRSFGCSIWREQIPRQDWGWILARAFCKNRSHKLVSNSTLAYLCMFERAIQKLGTAMPSRLETRFSSMEMFARQHSTANTPRTTTWYVYVVSCIETVQWKGYTKVDSLPWHVSTFRHLFDRQRYQNFYSVGRLVSDSSTCGEIFPSYSQEPAST